MTALYRPRLVINIPNEFVVQLVTFANGLVQQFFVKVGVHVDGNFYANMKGEMVSYVGQERNTTVVKLNLNSKVGLMNLKRQREKLI